MATVDLVMPKMGESIMEATILKWHKQPGDHVKMDETVLEIATDKVDTEVPSTTEGVMQEILYNVNDVVPVGAVIARIKTTADEGGTPEPQPPSQRQEEFVVEQHEPPQHTSNLKTSTKETFEPTSNGNGRFYSPLVLNIAASEGVSMSELENIPGTGNEGRVTKKDILQYVSQRKTGSWKSQARARKDVAVIEQSDESSGNRDTALTTYTGNVEII